MIIVYFVSKSYCFSSFSTGCTRGWKWLGDRCIRIIKSYNLSNTLVSLAEASSLCKTYDGQLLTLSDSLNLETITLMLQLWRHNSSEGAIWIAPSAPGSCNTIKVKELILLCSPPPTYS